jgi:hypothetical protein
VVNHPNVGGVWPIGSPNRAGDRSRLVRHSNGGRSVPAVLRHHGRYSSIGMTMRSIGVPRPLCWPIQIRRRVGQIIESLPGWTLDTCHRKDKTMVS